MLRHRCETGRARDVPIYKYGMIDDYFMLAPVVAAYLLDRPDGRRRAAALLTCGLAAGTWAGDALVRNLTDVAAQCSACAAAPRAANFNRLKPGRTTGQWRDSEAPRSGSISFRRQHSVRGRGAYHGTPIWAWQQAVSIAGLDRQLARTDLPPAVTERLAKARRDAWTEVSRTSAL